MRANRRSSGIVPSCMFWGTWRRLDYVSPAARRPFRSLRFVRLVVTLLHLVVGSPGPLTSSTDAGCRSLMGTAVITKRHIQASRSIRVVNLTLTSGCTAPAEHKSRLENVYHLDQEDSCSEFCHVKSSSVEEKILGEVDI